MRRAVPLLGVLCLVLLGAVSSAEAQARFIGLGGVNYALLSETFDVQQEPGFHVQGEFRVIDNIYIGAMYQRVSTTDDIDRGDDVEIDYYGLTGTWIIAGDEDMRLLGIASAGAGSLTYDTPVAPDPGRVNDTDISYWYEAGTGIEFGIGANWAVRFQLTYRRISPDEESMVLESSTSALVPAVSAAFRF
jgi:hypothetical protein